jgi:hypothetical protein
LIANVSEVRGVNMPKLFMIRERKKGSIVRAQDGEIIYFSNKMEAKLFRDRLGGRAVVSLAPDHKLYETGSRGRWYKPE